MYFFKDLGEDNIIFSVTVFLVAALILFVLRSLAMRALVRWARSTETKLDDMAIEAVRQPSFFWVLALSLYAAIAMSEFGERYVRYALSALNVLIIFSVTFAVANILAGAVRYHLERSVKAVPVTGLLIIVIKGIVLLLGGLVVLNGLGVSITPIVTALGVGGLAVALALQDTLSNVFAGIYMLAEQSVRVGDYIKLDSGEEGYVEDIGWRTVKIRKLQNNMVIVPNNKLAQSIVTNYNLPEQNMSLLVSVGVSYDSDIDKVEAVLIEEATKAATEVDGLLPDPAPFVRFIPGFGESSLDFTLICRVREFVDQYHVQHELRKRIFKRFKQEGIEIPFPIRTVHLKKEH
ncbi:MAG: mechanosensitive ion channel family protein [Deltaproteobacteria bacterium]|nr:mechanosensitive ion channel family protein [Deltaproteobacteria bacterium]